MDELINKHCKACETGTAAMDKDQAMTLMKKINDWMLNDEATEIKRSYKFKNYYHTLAFVNAVAWIAHQEDHHPTLTVHYNRCDVLYNTHSVNGLSENDFICAAKIDALFSNQEQ